MVVFERKYQGDQKFLFLSRGIFFLISLLSKNELRLLFIQSAIDDLNYHCITLHKI